MNERDEKDKKEYKEWWTKAYADIPFWKQEELVGEFNFGERCWLASRRTLRESEGKEGKG